MKKSVLIKTVIASSMLLASAGSYAADGTVTFNGKVTAASCTVTGGATGGGSASTALNVTMPSITTGSIGTTAGDLAGMTAFTITLTDCKSQSTTAEKMRVAFSGQGDPTNQYVLKNTASTGGATGVGIQLLKEDGTSIIDINGGSNKADETTLPISTDTAESYILNFNAAYVNVSGSAPTAGTVTSVANYTIEYN
ncbi:major fimbrial subunit (involved in the expression of type III fimbriae) MrkA [Vibrio orientalis CIP 102891 = ATCC 33934]|uniref:Fimbrial protein n=1 Tax=Vibrio orientalis CIP 102891 = ATCC 33934 TaxID=675816 RepID=C9QEV6_VIBOR|nr:fimbrial protein [Vibrio orientalis]EEX94665.1 fimbrial protein precursor [Vibrio orientalis CIP 102891 = ATCC 33934]EGU51362.1 major fimbrial subunit (involved in the expression of type III fimbriae) MrkA [Vibrio orientalis CIP 102891 = ATCC 33934]